MASGHPAHLNGRELFRVFPNFELEVGDVLDEHVLGDAGEFFVIRGSSKSKKEVIPRRGIHAHRFRDVRKARDSRHCQK